MRIFTLLPTVLNKLVIDALDTTDVNGLFLHVFQHAQNSNCLRHSFGLTEIK